MLLHLDMVLGLLDSRHAPDWEAHHANLQSLARAQELHHGHYGLGFVTTEARFATF